MPEDRAVEPAGTGSRSMTRTSTPASPAASAATRPQAPAPTIATGTEAAKVAPAPSSMAIDR